MRLSSLADYAVVMMSAAPKGGFGPPGSLAYDAFLHKPFGVGPLLETIARLLAGS